MEAKRKQTVTLTILIVEDDDDASRILGLMIASRFSDVTVEVAASGEEGLALYRQQQPQVVLTDIQMPGMDGIIMAEKIKSLNPSVKLIFMTGYRDQYDLTRLEPLGVSDCMMKPLDLKKLFQSIDSCLDQVRLEQL